MDLDDGTWIFACQPSPRASGWVAEPIVILVHGGSWGNLGFDNASGGDDKSDTLVQNRCWDLAGWGYIVININYPLLATGGAHTSEMQFAAIQRAIRWVRHGDLATLTRRDIRRFRAC